MDKKGDLIYQLSSLDDLLDVSLLLLDSVGALLALTKYCALVCMTKLSASTVADAGVTELTLPRAT